MVSKPHVITWLYACWLVWRFLRKEDLLFSHRERFFHDLRPKMDDYGRFAYAEAWLFIRPQDVRRASLIYKNGQAERAEAYAAAQQVKRQLKQKSEGNQWPI